jgi:polysaccharide biosynthesis protein PelB
MTPSASPGRKRLAPPWMIASVGVVMVVLLFFLFPRSSLFGQLGHGSGDAQADSLRVLLLRNLMLKGGAGPELRKDYIRQLGLTGDYTGAFEELDRLLPGFAGRSLDSLRVLEIEIASHAVAADSADVRARSRLKAALGAMTAPGTEPGMLAWAAGKAEAAGEYATAQGLYTELGAALGIRKDARAAHWYHEAARLASARGECVEAAGLHFRSQAEAAGASERKNAFLDGLRSLEACEQMELAVREAEARLGGLRSDPQVLLFLVNLARAANRPREAEKYALMLIRPGSRDAGPRAARQP